MTIGPGLRRLSRSALGAAVGAGVLWVIAQEQPALLPRGIALRHYPWVGAVLGILVANFRRAPAPIASDRPSRGSAPFSAPLPETAPPVAPRRAARLRDRLVETVWFAAGAVILYGVYLLARRYLWR